MANYPLRTYRLIAAVGFVLATAVMATPNPVPAKPLAACTSGEDEDVYTTSCTPFLVPNSPGGFTTTAANPDIPEIDGVPCTGANSGACIGLAEDQVPQVVPRSTISSSP